MPMPAESVNHGKPKRRLSLRTRLFVEAYLANGGKSPKPPAKQATPMTTPSATAG